MDKKLFLIDGHSLIFRMYYAFLRHPMINSRKQDVSILFGFTKYLLEMVEKHQPTHLAVCFDPPGKTFRHEMYPQYKGTRQKTPELVIEALDPLTAICRSLDIPVVIVPGFEADDVLGSLAVHSANEGFDVYMVTPDKDFGQLIRGNIHQLKPGKSGGDDEVVGIRQLCDKLGISDASQVIDMLTICGDSADNVPGVDGVGEVGASRLISKYGSVENIYAHLDELTPRQRELFFAAKEHIALSKALVTIKTDIPIDVTADQMKISGSHRAEAMELFDFYEFSSLKRHLHLAPGQERPEAGEGGCLSWTKVDAGTLSQKARASRLCAIFVEADSDGVFSHCKGISAAVCADGVHYAVSGVDPHLLKDILQDASISKTGYNLKTAVNILRNDGIRLEGLLEDIELMHYIINPEINHRIDALAHSYLGVNWNAADTGTEESRAEASLFDVIEDEVSDKPSDFGKEAVASLMLRGCLLKELESGGAEKLFYEIEEPLQRVLADMERDGVNVDLAPLREYALTLSRELADIEGQIRIMAGDEHLNVSSPKQVGAVLFEKMRIDPRIKPRKDRRGGDSYPTDEETLMNYAESCPIIGRILEFREIKKLISTYIEPFASWVSPRDGRIHTTFNQALTSTGRLSSSRPNLQNIPIRSERGQQIRRAFAAPAPDRVIVSADYSQIELRLMAHFCGDEHMIKAFLEGSDVHNATAAKIFHVSPEEVTPQMRRTAKTANFGILYGISAFGLSQRLRIPRVAAKKIIEDYFTGFPTIGSWIEKTKAGAAEKGYVQTLMGRRRYVPDINSRNATVRALSERNAVNAPIQGTAADIIKIAMIRVWRRLREEGLQARMVLQIHDELLFEAPLQEVDALMDIIKTEMENVVNLSVPLTVECNYGKNWLEAH